MSRVFFDSNLFIYLFEDENGVGAPVKALLNRMNLRSDDLLTSALTVGEVLVKPIAIQDNALITRYLRMFRSKALSIIDFDEAAALEFAGIRQDRTIKSPDAMQLACAAAAKCDLFVTNDERLSKKVIPGIQFIVSLDRVPI